MIFTFICVMGIRTIVMKIGKIEASFSSREWALGIVLYTVVYLIFVFFFFFFFFPIIIYFEC